MAETYIFDSFAILALLRREPGSEVVSALLERVRTGEIRGCMTWVNLGEVAYIVERRWGKNRRYQVLGVLEATGIEPVEVERELALAAAEIKAGYALAYADAFAAALAEQEKGVLVTGDPEFGVLKDRLSIQWIAGIPGE